MTRKGKLRAEVIQADGLKKTKILSPVKYSKDATENSLSITAEMSTGAKLSSTSNNEIQLVYPDGDIVTFDRRIKTKDGWVSGVVFQKTNWSIFPGQSTRITLEDYTPFYSYFKISLAVFATARRNSKYECRAMCALLRQCSDPVRH